MNQIDRVFVQVLHERSLSRKCATAEAIARRLILCYQSGIRESGALKRMVGVDKRPVADVSFDALSISIQEVSMQEIAGGPNSQISPDDLEMLQRTFDRVCIWCSIPRYSKRADRLARHLTHQFRSGLSDEAALFETAMWLEKNADAVKYHSDV